MCPLDHQRYILKQRYRNPYNLSASLSVDEYNEGTNSRELALKQTGECQLPLHISKKLVIQIVVGIAIILWLVQLGNLNDVISTVSQINPVNIVGAVAFFITASTFVAFALCTTLRNSNPDVPLRKMIMASFAGQLLSDVTPVRSGYFMTPVFLKQLADIPVEKGMAGVLATGGVNSLVKVVLVLAGLAYFTSRLPLPAEVSTALYVGVIVLVIAGVFLILLMWERRLSKLVAKVEKIPIVGKKLREFIEMFNNVQTEGRKIRLSLMIIAVLILLSVMANAAALYLIFVGVWAPSLSLLDFFFMASFASVLTYIPVTIAGLGVQEAGYVLLLHLLNGLPLSAVNPSFVAFALITRVLFTGTDIIGLGPLLKVGLKPDETALPEVREPQAPTS